MDEEEGEGVGGGRSASSRLLLSPSTDPLLSESSCAFSTLGSGIERRAGAEDAVAVSTALERLRLDARMPDAMRRLSPSTVMDGKPE